MLTMARESSQKVGSLRPSFESVEVDFYLLPPEARWLPDGYEDDDVQAL